MAGDPTYTRRNPLGLARQFLHSYRLAFVHPFTGEVSSSSPRFRLTLPLLLDGVREAEERADG